MAKIPSYVERHAPKTACSSTGTPAPSTAVALEKSAIRACNLWLLLMLLCGLSTAQPQHSLCGVVPFAPGDVEDALRPDVVVCHAHIVYAGHALAYLPRHALPELPVGGEDVGPDEVEYTPICCVAVELQSAMFTGAHMSIEHTRQQPAPCLGAPTPRRDARPAPSRILVNGCL